MIEFGSILKKIVILFTLIDPIGAVPLFLAATINAATEDRKKFLNQLVKVIFISLSISAVAGSQLLTFFGVSLGSMQVGGGLIAFIFSIGMVMGHDKEIKQTENEKSALSKMQIVPLGIPLMAGPAALSFVMANTSMGSVSSVIEAFTGIFCVVLLTWVVLKMGDYLQPKLTPEILTLIEKLFGFLLAMLSVEMIAAGIRLLFKLGSLT